jgi:hypothetical protein
MATEWTAVFGTTNYLSLPLPLVFGPTCFFFIDGARATMVGSSGRVPMAVEEPPQWMAWVSLPLLHAIGCFSGHKHERAAGGKDMQALGGGEVDWVGTILDSDERRLGGVHDSTTGPPARPDGAGVDLRQRRLWPARKCPSRQINRVYTCHAQFCRKTLVSMGWGDGFSNPFKKFKSRVSL